MRLIIFLTAAKAVLAKQGKYIAAFAPFGYIKSDDDKHVLTPDPETAHIVKLIFELAIKGMKYTEIADYLNNNGYDSILTFLNKKGLKRSMYRDIGVREWNPTSVMEVLFNETYIGSVVYSKTEDNIDTGHAVVKRDKEDWIIVPDRHEPLVSVEDYKLAHKMIARREYQPRKPTGGWQPSLIRCSVCGKGLDKYIGKYYRCRNKHLSKIDIFGLHDAILESTRVMALTQLKEFEIKESGVQEHELIETEISNLKKKKDYYARLKFEMYDDYTKGNLSREVMAKKTKEIKEKIAIIEKDICDKSELLIARNDLYEDAEKEQLTKLSKLEEYNSNVIRCLVDHVKVYDNDHIEIIWNFDDFQVG